MLVQTQASCADDRLPAVDTCLLFSSRPAKEALMPPSISTLLCCEIESRPWTEALQDGAALKPKQLR